jgi:hypothetical protein
MVNQMVADGARAHITAFWAIIEKRFAVIYGYVGLDARARPHGEHKMGEKAARGSAPYDNYPGFVPKFEAHG